MKPYKYCCGHYHLSLPSTFLGKNNVYLKIDENKIKYHRNALLSRKRLPHQHDVRAKMARITTFGQYTEFRRPDYYKHCKLMNTLKIIF